MPLSLSPPAPLSCAFPEPPSFAPPPCHRPPRSTTDNKQAEGHLVRQSIVSKALLGHTSPSAPPPPVDRRSLQCCLARNLACGPPEYRFFLRVGDAAGRTFIFWAEEAVSSAVRRTCRRKVDTSSRGSTSLMTWSDPFGSSVLLVVLLARNVGDGGADGSAPACSGVGRCGCVCVTTSLSMDGGSSSLSCGDEGRGDSRWGSLVLEGMSWSI